MAMIKCISVHPIFSLAGELEASHRSPFDVQKQRAAFELRTRLWRGQVPILFGFPGFPLVFPFRVEAVGN